MSLPCRDELMRFCMTCTILLRLVGLVYFTPIGIGVELTACSALSGFWSHYATDIQWNKDYDRPPRGVLRESTIIPFVWLANKSGGHSRNEVSEFEATACDNGQESVVQVGAIPTGTRAQYILLSIDQVGGCPLFARFLPQGSKVESSRDSHTWQVPPPPNVLIWLQRWERGLPSAYCRQKKRSGRSLFYSDMFFWSRAVLS